MYSVGQDGENDGGEIPVVDEAEEEIDRADPFFHYRGRTDDIVLLFSAESPEHLPTGGGE